MKKNKMLLSMVLVGLLLMMGSSGQAVTTTLEVSDDAPIDQHENWANDTKGIPGTYTDATELKVSLYGDDYGPDDMRQDVMLKWDVSGLTADTVTDVTILMGGWDYSDGPIDVYGIDAAADSWAETNVTWNSWQATTKTLIHLGQMTSSGPYGTQGDTTFSSTALTALVQDWIDGTLANNGLILKLSGANPATGEIGDSFSAKEEGTSYAHPPQLVVTQTTSTVTGTVVIDGYVGDLSFVGVQVELRQGGTPVKTDRTLLDATGNFSISDVPAGAYDIAVKICTQLQKVISGVSVLDVTDIGTVTLQGGDLDGDGVVDINDIEIIVANWLSAGDS